MAEIPLISAPRWLRKAEKSEFDRVVSAREATGRPVLAAEADMVVDYVTTRLRLRDLNKRLRAVSVGELDSYDEATFLRMSRAIEAATATSRRLAKDLQLIGEQS